MNSTREYRGRILRKQKVESKLANYIIKQIIGEGSFANVFKAIHSLTEETVAIKIINKDKINDNGLLDRVKNEIQIQSKMFHQNIARIYQIVETDKKIYIIMEYVAKGELYNYISQNGPLKEATAANIFIKLLSALTYMHQQKITHRDIKLENVVLDRELNPKLIDFGLAKRYEDQMRHTICGSPSYLSPQIIEKMRNYNPELADVWSLGITLFVMLTRSYPFNTENKMEFYQSFRNAAYKKKYNFSNDLSEIFSLIFQPENTRITLRDLKQTNFVKKYSTTIPIHSINTEKQKLNIDQEIIQQIETKYHFPSNQVKNSVLTFQLNTHATIYYLTQQKTQRERQKEIIIRPYYIESPRLIKKDKKPSITKQNSRLFSNQSKEKRYSSIKANLPKINIFKQDKGKNFRVSIQKFRLRRTQSPQSPKRILDCVGGYRQPINQSSLQY